VTTICGPDLACESPVEY